ncbi:D-alanyl-D-alanine carboxypeptidase [Brevibacillus reuszeri]|uniref:D-alanyl-D-alanine carboxypeptidase n=1 Tax=Brevibacillus reuszeri TaxID=54915 RepID=A0ABQ0THE4_9BACL|nr:D-alanyl-D-alanine carboxypeptidase family protein [Brevibacillus reuszeri]MED1855541.1 D-alanyl-D-alanine carboxypeptidase [Brevibacillus reuszeri]GED67309.1 D-alanyl-D-alanine carboxypeptidase [Brevibacillus reuszeri]
MNRGILLVLLTFAVIGYAFFHNEISAWADLENEQQVVATENNHVNLDARAAILLDSHTGEVLYTKNADTLYPVASMSKMMTEYLLLEAVKEQRTAWTDMIPISKNAATTEGARVNLVEGKAYPLKDLYEAMAVGSANNAAVAIGEYLAGSTSAFAEQMNLKAVELNLRSSQFVNATGLGYDYGQNEMSARDVGILAYRLMNDFPDIIRVTSEPLIKLSSTKETVQNTNVMLHADDETVRVDGIDGLKTGFTDDAGYCFTGTAQRGNKRLISVVMGTKDEAARFTDTKKLLEMGFDSE